MYPLNLNYSLSNFSQFSLRKNSKTFQKVAQKILLRDNYTCQFCGFKAKKYQEIVNLDQNYKNNTAKNMVTACCFCAQACFIESVGEKGYGGGLVIYFPEISQNELNALCHTIFFAISSNSSHKETGQALLQMFRIRSNVIEKLLGEGANEPAVLGRLLLDYSENHRSKEIEQMLGWLRLMPSRGRFQEQIDYWTKYAEDH